MSICLMHLWLPWQWDDREAHWQVCSASPSLMNCSTLSAAAASRCQIWLHQQKSFIQTAWS